MVCFSQYGALAVALIDLVMAAPTVTSSLPFKLPSIPLAEFKKLKLSTIVPEKIILDKDSLNLNVTRLEPFHPSHTQKRSTNGPDNRYQYTNRRDTPYTWIGKFVRSDNAVCTAQLIGPRHVLTAQHCVSGEPPNTSMTFYPGYDNGPGPLGGGQVTSVIQLQPRPNDDDCTREQDWAILIIDKRFGDQLGYFGLVAGDTTKFDQAIFQELGYPGDRDNTQRPYRQDSITLPTNTHGLKQFACDGNSGPINADADVAGGESGGAVFNGGYLYGVLSRVLSYSDGSAVTIYGSGYPLLSTVQDQRKNYP